MIRKAALSDLNDIYKIEQSSFDEPWSKVSIEAEFYKDYADIYIYEERGKVLAYIITWHILHEAELVTIAVDGAYRRRGLGKLLLEYMLEYYKDCDLWHLEVDCSNNTAISLYEAFGFKISGTIENYYGNGKHAYRMIRYNDIMKEQYNVD